MADRMFPDPRQKATRSRADEPTFCHRLHLRWFLRAMRLGAPAAWVGLHVFTQMRCEPRTRTKALSFSYLASLTGMSRTRVQAALEVLEGGGLIDRGERPANDSTEPSATLITLRGIPKPWRPVYDSQDLKTSVPDFYAFGYRKSWPADEPHPSYYIYSLSIQGFKAARKLGHDATWAYLSRYFLTQLKIDKGVSPNTAEWMPYRRCYRRGNAELVKRGVDVEAEATKQAAAQGWLWVGLPAEG